MASVIIINGSINSGKSSVAKRMAESLPGSVFLEGDDLGNHHPELEEWIPTVLTDIVSFVEKHSSQYGYIVIAYPLRQEDWDFLSNSISSLYCITLSPPMETALSERNGRVLEEWEKERIRQMYQEGYNDRSFSLATHDNSQESIDQTVQSLIQVILTANA